MSVAMTSLFSGSACSVSLSCYSAGIILLNKATRVKSMKTFKHYIFRTS